MQARCILTRGADTPRHQDTKGPTAADRFAVSRSQSICSINLQYPDRFAVSSNCYQRARRFAADSIRSCFVGRVNNAAKQQHAAHSPPRPGHVVRCCLSGPKPRASARTPERPGLRLAHVQLSMLSSEYPGLAPRPLAHPPTSSSPSPALVISPPCQCKEVAPEENIHNAMQCFLWSCFFLHHRMQ